MEPWLKLKTPLLSTFFSHDQCAPLSSQLSRPAALRGIASPPPYLQAPTHWKCLSESCCSHQTMFFVSGTPGSAPFPRGRSPQSSPGRGGMGNVQWGKGCLIRLPKGSPQNVRKCFREKDLILTAFFISKVKFSWSILINRNLYIVTPLIIPGMIHMVWAENRS